MPQINIPVITKDDKYRQLVVDNIRVNYTQNDEFAMIADGIADATSASYVQYRADVTQAKADAHKEVYG